MNNSDFEIEELCREYWKLWLETPHGPRGRLTRKMKIQDKRHMEIIKRVVELRPEKNFWAIIDSFAPSEVDKKLIRDIGPDWKNKRLKR